MSFWNWPSRLFLLEEVFATHNWLVLYGRGSLCLNSGLWKAGKCPCWSPSAADLQQCPASAWEVLRGGDWGFVELVCDM